MQKWIKRIRIFLAFSLCMTCLTGCSEEVLTEIVQEVEDEEAKEAKGSSLEYDQDEQLDDDKGTKQGSEDSQIDEDGEYTSKEDVALYIHTYGKLPKNFITKKEAQKLGWQGGKLEPYAPGKSIGGDHFGNYEGQLPEKKGRTYRECDIDTKGKKRGAKRIIFSNDGLIYYTDDHYETFTLLYGEE